MKLINKLLRDTPHDLAFFAFANLVFICSFYVFLKNPYLSRWAPFLLIGFFGFTCLTLRSKFFNLLINSYSCLIYVAIILVLEVITFHNLVIKDNQTPTAKKIALIAILISLAFFFKNKSVNSYVSKALIVFVPFFYITNLLNYNNFVSILDQSILNFLIIVAIIKLLSVFDGNLKIHSNRLFEILIYFFLLLLSFRSDTLFSTHGSEYHWSYYANVIATYQSGGILLWDTPSQYGFLNIILGSILSKDPWESFYLFQSILLFAVSAAAFSTLNSLYGNRKFGTLLCALVTSVFFFSDPALIGPQPFPSSSVVRFGPSFLLLIAIVRALDSKRDYASQIKNFLINFIFIIGCLWSAESLLYCLTIYLAFNFSQLLIAFRDKERSVYIRQTALLLLPFGLLLVSYFLVFVYYIYAHQIRPDISMYFMYGKYYSEGFGSLPISIYGFLWTLLLPLLLLMSIFTSLFRNTSLNKQFILLFTISGAIFSWFSYFIGRAVPNNIMVLSPMIIWCYLVVIYHLESKLNNLIFSIFKICSYVFIVLHIGSYLIQPQLFSLFSLQKFKSFTSDISERRASISSSLSALTNDSNLAYNNFTYYGHAGTFPFQKNAAASNSNLWLPQPFALFDEPIPKRISDRIVDRYITRHQKDGSIVLDINNHNQKFFQDWLSRLSKHYNCHVNVENLDYKIYACKYIK